MPGQARQVTRPDANASMSSPGAVAQPTPVRTRQNHLFYFTDFNEDQLTALANEQGNWETEFSCVRKGCTHQPRSLCWDQDPVYPIRTKQPSFYLPRVVNNLPDSLSRNRKQWMYTCLLAKHYRMPVNLIFSAIKPYNNIISPVHKGRKKQIELDAYSLCVLYSAGCFIDKRRLLIDRLGFLNSYPKNNHPGFDWKFEDKKDRVFRWYDDGRWEEYQPDENPDDADGIPHDVKVECTLVYSRFLGMTNAEGASTNEFQKSVGRALKSLHRASPDEADTEVADLEQGPMDEDQEDAPQRVSSRAQSMVLPRGTPSEPQENRIQEQHEQQTPARELSLHLQAFQAKISDALKDLFEAEGVQDNHAFQLEGVERSERVVDVDAQPREASAPARNHNNTDGNEHDVPENELDQIPSVEAGNTNEGHRPLDQTANMTESESLQPNPTSRRIKNEIGGRANALKEESPGVESKFTHNEHIRLREVAEHQAATMKRKFEETLEELHQQKQQYHKLELGTKKEQARSNKRQKLLHAHVEGIYRKWDTAKLLQDDSNKLNGALDQVHENLDLLKQSKANDRAQLRKIIESEDQDDIRKQLRDWVAREEETTGERMDALEKLLSSDGVARPMDVAMELKESYAVWVKSVKPRVEGEHTGA
ncbi:hypothetical protein PG984_004081 [Apiospora sp. TS-2023a]